MPSSCQGRGGEGRVQEDTRGDEAARLFTRMRECYSQPALTSCFKPAMALCCSINRVCKSCKNNALRVTRHAPQSQASHSASASQAHKQTAISITSKHKQPKCLSALTHLLHSLGQHIPKLPAGLPSRVNCSASCACCVTRHLFVYFFGGDFFAARSTVNELKQPFVFCCCERYSYCFCYNHCPAQGIIFKKSS